MSYKQKYWLQEILAYLVSVGVPIVTTLVVFPDSVTENVGTSMSMSFVLTIVVSITAFRKQIGKLFEHSPVMVTWIIILVISVVLKNFAEQMFIISLTAVGASAGATPIFNLAHANKQKADLLAEEKLKKEISEKV